MGVQEVTHCRSCDHDNLVPALDLGQLPIVNELIPKEDGSALQQERFPLRIAVCNHCGLAQTDIKIDRNRVFGADYPYLSSCSASLLEVSSKAVCSHIQKFGLDEQSFVVEVASNDGYLLRNFVAENIPCLGVEPTSIAVARARELGVTTVEDYFGSEVASRVCKEHGRADLVLANNVLAHIAEIPDFLAGVRELLSADGTFVLEVQYLGDLLRHASFDLIYHEHHSYFTLSSLDTMLSLHGLRGYDVEHLSTQGGSIRVYARLEGGQAEVSPSYGALLAEEAASFGDLVAEFGKLQQQVLEIRGQLHDTLGAIQKSGGRIAAYGAAAKGIVLLNVCDLARYIEFVVDANPVKQQCLMPGTDIPILSPQQISDAELSHMLILAWNLAEEIMQQLSDHDLTYLVPMPKPRVIKQ
jgi:hypothetical protein